MNPRDHPVDTDPVIVAARRTPIATRGRALAAVTAEHLATPVVGAVVDDAAALGGIEVADVVLGNCMGPGGNIARVAALGAGLGVEVPGLTIDRQCGSGLAAVIEAVNAIRAGDHRARVAGGVESASTAPVRSVDGKPYDRAPFAPEGWPDPGMTRAADDLAAHDGISRARQDTYSLLSHRRAAAAFATAAHDAELVPLPRLPRDESAPTPDTPGAPTPTLASTPTSTTTPTPGATTPTATPPITPTRGAAAPTATPPITPTRGAAAPTATPTITTTAHSAAASTSTTGAETARERSIHASLTSNQAANSRRSTFFGGDDGTDVGREAAERAGARVGRMLPRFAPLFEGGTLTPGNTCRVSDGAAAVLVVPGEARGDAPGLAVRGSAVVGCDPALPGIGAAPAVLEALARAGRSIGEMAAIEIVEAFAAQTLAVLDRLGLADDDERVCAGGGALALGHPWGASGAVVLVRLFSRLVRAGAPAGTLGVAAASVGGGLGVAMVVEVVR